MLPELLEDLCVLADNVGDELCRTAQFRPHEDKPFAEIMELLSLQVHIIAVFVRLQVVLHDEGRERLKLNLVDRGVLLEKPAQLLTRR